MRITEERKSEIRHALIQAAVELFTEKGFSGATMREISTRAGLAAGTIYNYFPSKEKIFFAYFEKKQEELQATLGQVSDLAEFTLKEKLQILVESLLDSYTDDREFVATTYKVLLDSPLRSFTDLGPAKRRLTDIVREFYASAVAAKEIQEQPFEGFLVNLFWEYTNLIVLYWLRDDSDGFVNTSRLVDLSLDLYVDLVVSGMVTKTADLLSFLLKSHIYGNIDKLYELLAVVGALRKSRDDAVG